MEFDIIIPVWNQADLTVKCLMSIRKFTGKYRVIVIDNGSDPEEWDKIESELANHENVEVVANTENVGFVKATNQGINLSTADYVVLMNNDTEAVPHWTDKLKEPLVRNSAIAMSGPLTTTRESWQGKYPKGKKGYAIRKTGMLAFFCVMIRKEVIGKIGLLDEQFGVGFGDDDDYCRRVTNAGYWMALVQDLVIPHHHRSTFRKIYDNETIVKMQDEAMKKYKGKYNLPDAAPQLATVNTESVNNGEGLDIVYVLGNGSKWNNNELRFSLRAIEKNLTGVRNIVIVGENPGFISDDVIYIQYPDELGATNADGNIIRKVLRACKEPWLSDNFLFINDDHIILKKMHASAVPPLHKGTLSKHPDSYFKFNYWRNRLEATKKILLKMGLPDNHFDCHTPIVFNKKLFTETMGLFNYSEGIGYTMKSLYGNVNCKSAPLLKNEKFKVFQKMNIQQIDHGAAPAMFMAINDDGLNNALKLWLIRTYPEKCRWETAEIEDRVIEITKWLESGRNYEEAVALYKKYFRGINLAYLYETGKNDLLMQKLIWKFNQALKEYETS